MGDLPDFAVIGAAVVTGFCAVPTVAYKVLERRHRGAWPPRSGPRVPLEQGAYRRTDVDSLSTGRAPGVVRLAAWTCFALGQMAVPGMIAGTIGLLAFGLGIVSVPGIIAAFRLWSAGAALLRNDAGAVSRAREVARYVLWLNAAVAVLCVPFAVIPASARHDDLRVAFVALTAPYVLVSVAQALLLRRAADTLAASAVAPPLTPSPLPASPRPA